MPPIARTLWACSSVLVASLKRTLPHNVRPPPTLCLFSRFKQAFFCLWSTIFRGTCNFSSSFASCSYQRRFESLPRELCRTASHFEIECYALDKEGFEKWREKKCPLSGHQESRPAKDGFVKDLLHLFKLKKGSGTTEVVHWLLREFNRAADKLADWALLAWKIRQFVKHHWDAQRQAPGPASAMLAQHRAPSFSSIASGFTKLNSRHVTSMSSSSCSCHGSLERLTSHLQRILQAVTNKSSHLFITLPPPLRIPKFLSLLCVHEPPPRMRIMLLSDIQICFCGGQGSLQASKINRLFLVRGDGTHRCQVCSSGPPQERKTRECERRTLSLWSTDKLAIPKSTQRRLQAR